MPLTRPRRSIREEGGREGGRERGREEYVAAEQLVTAMGGKDAFDPTKAEY
jgi:hypothetical protein